MIAAADWVRAYARQADVDLRAWELYEQHPNAVAAECHKLLFLQMACEKLCKAHLIRSGTKPDSLQTSHGYIAKPLPVVIREQIGHQRRSTRGVEEIIEHVRHIAREIELLNPSMQRSGQRPDNCEYPWRSGNSIVSPLDWTFHPARLVAAPAGRTFLKLLRGAIDRVLG